MILCVCDRCGKQVDRFARFTKYKIERSAREYGFDSDRSERQRCNEPSCMYRGNLNLCQDCQRVIDDLLDKEFSAFPKSVTLSTEL